MKKILLLFVCLFLLVGCSLKKETNKEENTKEAVLTCSNLSEGTVNFTTNMIYYFKGDKLVDLGVKYVYDLSVYDEEYRNNFTKANMCSTDAFETTLGMRDCKEELVGTDYVVEGYADKLFKQSTGTLDKIKSSYISEGWTCTEK